MNKLFYPVAAVLILAGSAFTFLTAQSWQIADGYSITFTSAGHYPYYCAQHYAAGMVGAIEVRD